MKNLNLSYFLLFSGCFLIFFAPDVFSDDLIKPSFLKTDAEAGLKQVSVLIFKWTIFICLAGLVIGMAVGGLKLGGVFGKKEEGWETIKNSIIGTGVVGLAGTLIGAIVSVTGN